eukprot:9508962-Prorocentrum_lima.AAC.1
MACSPSSRTGFYPSMRRGASGRPCSAAKLLRVCSLMLALMGGNIFEPWRMSGFGFSCTNRGSR